MIKEGKFTPKAIVPVDLFGQPANFKELERIAKNKNREVNRLDLEKLDFHNKVRETFLELSKKYKDRYVVIDASKSFDEVVDAAYKVILEKLK